MDYLTNYYKNLSEQLQERVNHLKNLLEARPTFTPMTVAYDDSGDPEPNVATLTDEQEADLRVDQFGGRYPSKDFAQMSRSLSDADTRQYQTGRELNTAVQQAEREYLGKKTFRGKPVSNLSYGSKARTKAQQEFRAEMEAGSFPDIEKLKERLEGQKILGKLSMDILKSHPAYNKFIEDETLRGDIIMGRRNFDGSPRASYERDRWTGD